jgi:predicted Fe-Mo cluster-binding NifX family protein
MKIALSVWKDCISTVFDAADQLLVVEKDGDGALKLSTVRLNSTDKAARALQMKESGIDVLICGAISRPQEVAISAAGIKVHAFVRGPVQEIIAAYGSGQLHTAAFTLPGCQGRGFTAGRRRGNGTRCRWRSS